MSGSQIFFGIALTVGLAVGCQIIASAFHIPAIISAVPLARVLGLHDPETTGPAS